jgi:hypothetical protein
LTFEFHFLAGSEKYPFLTNFSKLLYLFFPFFFLLTIPFSFSMLNKVAIFYYFSFFITNFLKYFVLNKRYLDSYQKKNWTHLISHYKYIMIVANNLKILLYYNIKL